MTSPETMYIKGRPEMADRHGAIMAATDDDAIAASQGREIQRPARGISSPRLGAVGHAAVVARAAAPQWITGPGMCASSADRRVRVGRAVDNVCAPPTASCRDARWQSSV